MDIKDHTTKEKSNQSYADAIENYQEKANRNRNYFLHIMGDIVFQSKFDVLLELLKDDVITKETREHYLKRWNSEAND